MRRTGLPIAVLASAALLLPAAAEGATWSTQSVADPTGAASSELMGVSCAGASDCLAVGVWDDNGTPTALGAVWASGSWALQAPSIPLGASSTDLAGASCTGASACTAVGNLDTQAALAERWTGSWAVQSTPRPVGAVSTSLAGVSCSSASECTAVGSWNDGTDQKTLALRWTSGGGWTVQTTPNPTGARVTGLSSVSCDASANCTAVGTNYDATPTTVAMTRIGATGTWTLETTPNAGSAASYLSGVSCTSSSDCTAVGFSNSTVAAPLAMTRISGRWTIESAPTPAGATGAALSGVSCAVRGECTAVGYSYSGAVLSPLAEDRTAGTWTAAAPPLPGGSNGGRLTGVSCSARAVCTAVGFRFDGNFDRRALIDRYS